MVYFRSVGSEEKIEYPLHYWYKSAEQKMSKKNVEYLLLNYLISMYLQIIMQQQTIKEISISNNNWHLEVEGGAVRFNFERGTPKDYPSQVSLNLVQWFQRRRFKCESLWWTTGAKWWQKVTWPFARSLINWQLLESKMI